MLNYLRKRIFYIRFKSITIDVLQSIYNYWSKDVEHSLYFNTTQIFRDFLNHIFQSTDYTSKTNPKQQINNDIIKHLSKMSKTEIKEVLMEII